MARHHVTMVRYGPVTAMFIAMVMVPVYLLKIAVVTFVLFYKGLFEVTKFLMIEGQKAWESESGQEMRRRIRKARRARQSEIV